MAIDDNANYTLTGAQVKDLAQRVQSGGGGGVLIGYINYTAGTVPSGSISVYTDTTYTTAISADDVAAALDNGYTVFFKFTDGWDEIKILSIADSEIMIGDNTVVYHFMASSSKDSLAQLQGHVNDWGVANFLSALKSVNNGTLTIQHNGTTVQTFTANSSTAKTANVETIYADPIASSAAITPLVQTSMIANGAVTADKISWTSVGSTSSGVLRTVVREAYRAVPNSTYTVFTDDASSVIPSGYTPVGLVGLEMTGAGYTSMLLTTQYISGNTITWCCQSPINYDTGIYFRWRILCVKTS